MKKLQPTTQYKKDYKRVKNNSKKVGHEHMLFLERLYLT